MHSKLRSFEMLCASKRMVKGIYSVKSVKYNGRDKKTEEISPYKHER